MSTQTGIHTVRVQASDGGSSATQTFNLAVNAINFPPQVTSEAPYRALIDTTYNYQIIANDPEGQALTFSLLGAPQGMTLSTQGLVSWVPTEADAGAHQVSVRVSDPLSANTLYEFVVFAVNDNGFPVISSTAVTEARTEDGYSYPVAATDPEGDTLSYQLLIAPGAMSVDTQGQITWLPTEADIGIYPVVIEVSDGQGHTVEQGYQIRVTAPGLWNRRRCR